MTTLLFDIAAEIINLILILSPIIVTDVRITFKVRIIARNICIVIELLYILVIFVYSCSIRKSVGMDASDRDIATCIKTEYDDVDALFKSGFLIVHTFFATLQAFQSAKVT